MIDNKKILVRCLDHDCRYANNCLRYSSDFKYSQNTFNIGHYNICYYYVPNIPHNTMKSPGLFYKLLLWLRGDKR